MLDLPGTRQYMMIKASKPIGNQQETLLLLSLCKFPEVVRVEEIFQR
jgi:hypothetical protein